MNYIDLLKKIHNDVEQNDSLEILEYQFQPGLDGKHMVQKVLKLREVSPYFGSFDFADIFEFYKQCDGFKLVWQEKNVEEPRKGAIEIMSFDSVFLYTQDFINTSVENPEGTDFNGQTYPENSFGERLMVFDSYSEFEGVAFVFDPSFKKPQLMILTDYYAVWNSSKLTDLVSYFNLLGASRGCFTTRHKVFYKYRGDTLEPMVFNTIPYGTEFESEIFK